MLFWGGYDENAAEGSTALCPATDWSEDWLGDQAADFGITVTAH